MRTPVSLVGGYSVDGVMRWLVVATTALVLVAGGTEAAEIKVYSAGLSTKAANPEVARAFLAFLARPQFKAKFAAAALDFKE